ncbi:unnamed protein product [Sympodiomycopsis kandeliae]
MLPFAEGSRTRRRRTLLSSLFLLPLLLLITITSFASAQQTAAPTSTDGGLLNGPIKATSISGQSPSSTTPRSTASTSVPSLELSNTAVPYLLQRPAPAHVKHKTRPRVKTQFSGCSDTGLDHADAAQRINISAVYTQLDRSVPADSLTSGTNGVLRITGVGAIAEEGFGAANETFAAIQVQSRFLTFDIFSNLTFLCDNIAPAQPDNTTQLVAHASCTYGPGEVAFGVDVPINASYELGTLWTRVLLIDTSHPPLSIACVDVPFSPYQKERWYWDLMFYLPIGLFLAYFVSVSLARAITAATTRSKAFRNRAREGSAPSFLRDHLNPIIISAISGQGMVLSPALLRFCTPGCWDILFHLQFVTILAMCAVNWPDFAYPFFKQAAWASLVANVTLVQSSDQPNVLANPTLSNATLPSGAVGEQMGNISSPIYLNTSAPPNFLDLKNAYTGIPAFAEMVGIHKADLFGTAMAVWLLIVAVFVAVALIGWVIDTIALATTKIKRQREESGLGYQTPSDNPKGVDTMGSAITKGHQNGLDSYPSEANGHSRDSKQSSHYGFLGSWPKGFNPNPHFHIAALHGNIVRAVTMFHLPLTVFTVYQMAHADEFSKKSVALAALSFTIVCIILPAWLIWRIAKAPVKKLYDNIETLLALGPVYNTFSPGSQLFCCVTFAYSLIVGVVIGAASASGSAQSIILLVLEVLLALALSLWLPWGEGAMMGPASFMTSVLRVISAVLLVLLSPIVDLSSQATQWITYVVLLLQGIFFAGATLILVFKLVESFIRVVFGVPYDERVNARSGGIGGAIRRIRRRRDKILQLSKPARRGHRPSQSSSSSLMFARPGGPNTPVQMSATRPGSFISLSGNSAMKAGGGPVSPGGGAVIPLSRSRQASFASYLDFSQQQQQQGQPISPGGSMAMTPAVKRQSLPLSDLSNGPYAAYFQTEGDDDDAHIMAAMPPTSPGPWGPSPLPVTPGSAGKMPPNSAGSSNAATAALPSVGFQRVGGGRASNADPYASIGKQRHRDGFGRNPGVEFSSTAAAAQFSRAHSRRDTMRSNGGGRGIGNLFRGFSRRSPHHGASEEDYITDEEEEDDPWAGTWGTSTLSTQHGPWNGLAKMQAALSGLRGRLAGHAPPRAGSSSGEGGTLGGVSEEGGSLGPAESGGGFQVIRAPRRGHAGGGHGESSQQEPRQEAVQNQDMPAGADQTEDLMDSTAIAMHSAYGGQRGSTPGVTRGGEEGRPHSRGSSAFFTPPPSRPLSSSGMGVTHSNSVSGTSRGEDRDRSSTAVVPMLQLRHLNSHGESLNLVSQDSGDTRRSTLGILGADLERATSDARRQDLQEERNAELNREDRFWLPTNSAGSGSGSGSPATWRNVQGQSAKIEFMASPPES